VAINEFCDELVVQAIHRNQSAENYFQGSKLSPAFIFGNKVLRQVL
jgi:hypothetical protein